MTALPPPDAPDDVVMELRGQLEDARRYLHDAQAVAALLAVDVDADGNAVTVAHLVIERDLAARRVTAWTAVLDQLRAEGRRLGLFT